MFNKKLRTKDETLQTIWGDFVFEKETFENRTEASIRWFQGETNLFLDYLLAHDKEHSIKEFNEENYLTYFKHRSSNMQVSRNTICSSYKVAKSFILYLLKKNLILSNPLSQIPKPRPEVPLPKFLSINEVKRIIEFLQTYDGWKYKFERIRNLAIFQTFIFLGLRLQELLNITTDDLNLEDRTLKIVKGKGNKDRLLPIPKSLHPILADYLIARKKFARCDKLFVSCINGKELGKTAVYKILKVINREVPNLKFKLYPHALRHTSATMLLEGSGDLRAVQSLLGHTTLLMATRYASCSTTHLLNQMEKSALSASPN